MADVAAKDVAALRKATGAGMMDCKQALAASAGDMDAAKTWLRERNLAGASKRAGREAQEGAVDVFVDGTVGAVVELVCETDFVAKGDIFRTTVAELAKLVAEQGDDDLTEKKFNNTTVADAIVQLSGQLGEKIQLGRVARYESNDGLLDGYRHIQNERGTIAVLVELAGVDPANAKVQEVAHDIALHIASAAPRYVSRDEIPTEVVEQERSVFENLTRNEGKPEQAIGKIVEGRLNGFYKETALLEQAFVKDPKVVIGTLVEGLGPDASVRRFIRTKIGED